MEHADGSDTEQLIAAIRGGDLELYAIVIKRYQQPLYVYCYHLLLQREEAEDAVQDILIKGYEKLHLYTYGQSFMAWLYKMAYHHCLNLLKKRRRTELLGRLLAPLVKHQSEDDGYALARRKEIRELGRISLLRLTPLERLLIIWRVMESRSYEEIGRMLPYSAAALRKKTERAKARLRKVWIELEGEGDEHEYEYGPNHKEAAERELAHGTIAAD